jgi:hypothetical protein
MRVGLVVWTRADTPAGAESAVFYRVGASAMQGGNELRDGPDRPFFGPPGSTTKPARGEMRSAPTNPNPCPQ